LEAGCIKYKGGEAYVGVEMARKIAFQQNYFPKEQNENDIKYERQ